jgi:hypothetical protein
MICATRRYYTLGRRGPNDEPPPEDGFDATRFTPERWDEVEDAMWQIYAIGITHSRDFVNVVAEEAYAIGLEQATAARIG